MSNPKDKANQLVDVYRTMLMNEDTECGNEILCTVIAKKSALIAIEEILKLNHPIAIVYTETSDNLIEQYTQEYYWEQVKHEIQKI